MGHGGAVTRAGSNVGPYSLVRSESGVHSKDSSDGEGSGNRVRGDRDMDGDGEAHGGRRHRGKRAGSSRSRGEHFGLDSGAELVGDMV